MNTEKLIGLGLILVCAFMAAIKARECFKFHAESAKTNGIVVGHGGGDVQIEYTDSTGAKMQSTLPMGYRKRTPKFMLDGKVIPLYIHKRTKAVRNGSFLSFWFDPLIYSLGIVLGLVFLLRPRHSNSAV